MEERPRITERPVRRALSRADLPDPFTRSLYKLSPYRGCAHGCRYCDGRAERYYVEGDFERDLELRTGLPELLAAELSGLRERGMVAIGSGTTDPYQRLEAEARTVGRCAQLLADSQVPTCVMTKSDLVLRDLDAWARLGRGAGFLLMVSITTLDDGIRQVFEPGAPSPAARLAALRTFKEAGCAVGALVMPLLPLISDDEAGLRALYGALSDIGVDFAMPGGLTLRPGRQKELYRETVRSYRPELMERLDRTYDEDRPSGMPRREASAALFRTVAAVRADHSIPPILPHGVHRRILPPHDSFRILLRDLAELYGERGVDTRPLLRGADRYDAWLLGLRRHFRRRRSLPASWLEDRFSAALSDGELAAVLDNRKLSDFAVRVLRDGETVDYRTLKTG